MIECLSSEIHAGAEKPFTLLHVSDTHLAYADERDCERKIELARKRFAYFSKAAENLQQAVDEAKRSNALLVHTGDLIDFVSRKNLDLAKQFTDENDCFFTAGNHEFSQYVGEAFEDAAYRNQSYADVQKSFKNDLRCASRVVNGVNLVSLGDSYYLFDEQQASFLEAECKKGLPVLLFLHTPLYAEDLCYQEMVVHQHPVAFEVAAPKELVETYNEYRCRQQMPDALTLEVVDYIKHCDRIRAIIAGHVHYGFVSQLTPALRQYIAGLTCMRKITVD